MKNTITTFQVVAHALVQGQTLVAEIICDTDKGPSTGKIELYTGGVGADLSSANGNIVTICLSESCLSAVVLLLQSGKSVHVEAGPGVVFAGLSC